MKKVVSFDLDGTLVNGVFGDMVWNVGIPEEYARRYSLSFDEAKQYILREYEAVGDENILWYTIDYWLERFDISVSSDVLLQRYVNYIELLPDTKEVLEKLQERYTLIIASNAARIFVEKELLSTGIAHYFTHIISATTDYNLVKKQEKFYQKLCTTLNVHTDQLIHVGDHLIYDFYVPSKLGIESYFIRSDGKDMSHVLLPDQESVERYTIRNLKELLDKI